MTGTEKPGCAKRLAGAVLALIFGLLLMAATLELGLRLKPNQFVAWLPTRFDPVLGYTPQPGLKTWWAGSCFFVPQVRFNGLGFRGPQPAPRKTRPRVVVFGDSFMEALQVKDGETFAHLLGRHTGAEVINFGRTGSGAAHALALYRRVARPLKPDVVILAHLLGNDLRDDWVPPAKRGPGGVALARISTTLWRGRVVEQKPVRDPARDWQAVWFRFYLPRFWVVLRAKLQDKLSALRGRLPFGGNAGPGPSAGATARPASPAPWYGRDSYAEFEVYRPPQGQWTQLWHYETRLVNAFAQQVQKDGAKFVVMTVPGVLEQLPDPKALLGTMVPGPIPNDWNPQAAQALWRRRLTRRGVAVLNLLPAFKNKPSQAKNNTPVYSYACDGHWNAKGHALAAKKAAAWLKTRGWLPTQGR